MGASGSVSMIVDQSMVGTRFRRVEYGIDAALALLALALQQPACRR